MENPKIYSILFYKDKNDIAPIAEYLRFLANRKDKDSRIKLRKIQDYIKALRIYGLQIGEPYIKHLSDDIWELRPIRDRILFAKWTNGGFILLHHFKKKTQKTPRREIEQAKLNLKNFIERSKNNEKNK